MKFRQKVGRKKVGTAKHHYMLSGVEASGTMVFVCRNCPSDIRVERATMYTMLVMHSDALKFLPKVGCPQAFPDGLIRILPERNYAQDR